MDPPLTIDEDGEDSEEDEESEEEEEEDESEEEEERNRAKKRKKSGQLQGRSAPPPPPAAGRGSGGGRGRGSARKRRGGGAAAAAARRPLAAASATGGHRESGASAPTANKVREGHQPEMAFLYLTCFIFNLIARVRGLQPLLLHSPRAPATLPRTRDGLPQLHALLALEPQQQGATVGVGGLNCCGETGRKFQYPHSSHPNEPFPQFPQFKQGDGNVVSVVHHRRPREGLARIEITLAHPIKNRVDFHVSNPGL